VQLSYGPLHLRSCAEIVEEELLRTLHNGPSEQPERECPTIGIVGIRQTNYEDPIWFAPVGGSGTSSQPTSQIQDQWPERERHRKCDGKTSARPNQVPPRWRCGVPRNDYNNPRPICSNSNERYGKEEATIQHHAGEQEHNGLSYYCPDHRSFVVAGKRHTRALAQRRVQPRRAKRERKTTWRDPGVGCHDSLGTFPLPRDLIRSPVAP